MDRRSWDELLVQDRPALGRRRAAHHPTDRRGHDPADAEQLVSGTWGMRHASATADALTTFAATT